MAKIVQAILFSVLANPNGIMYPLQVLSQLEPHSYSSLFGCIWNGILKFWRHNGEMLQSNI